ncbi:MAG: polyphosphate polymerase domain-containing protein [Verrucomicrobia bacterium]|nr:polyphosphate polymerase domain-containing protein [Verrucomicrobiota bacterium]
MSVSNVDASETDAHDPRQGYRFERKYHIQDLTEPEIEMWIKRSPALFFECFPPRYINNIYFDTPDLSNYHENLSGQATRTKIRLRWYGNFLHSQIKTTLEYKIKRGMVGTKDSFKLPPLNLTPGFSYHDLKHFWESCEIPAHVHQDVRLVVPTMCNRYHRKYYLSADGMYRITIDTHLEFIAIDRFDCQFNRIRTLEGSVVVELKYSGDISTLDERLVNFFPFRITRMSKYVTGVELLNA